MMAPLTLPDLIACLESAEEGSRELDAEIAATVGRTPGLPYTSSMDSALKLVPEGERDVSIDYIAHRSWREGGGVPGFWQARICLELASDDEEETGPEELGEARTPALALCIAALKTRAAQ